MKLQHSGKEGGERREKEGRVEVGRGRESKQTLLQS